MRVGRCTTRSASLAILEEIASICGKQGTKAIKVGVKVATGQHGCCMLALGGTSADLARANMQHKMTASPAHISHAREPDLLTADRPLAVLVDVYRPSLNLGRSAYTSLHTGASSHWSRQHNALQTQLDDA